MEGRQQQACKRARLPVPLHMPGDVAGDGTERFAWGVRIQCVRDGHGYVAVHLLPIPPFESNLITGL